MRERRKGEGRSWSIDQIARIWELLTGDMPMGDGASDATYSDYWERRRGWVEAFPRRAERVRAHMDAIVGEIEDGASVLDIGCGDGELLAQIRERRPRCLLKGIDLSESAVQLTRAKGLDAKRLDVVSGDLAELGVFDHVVMSEVVEHVPDPERLLCQAGRLARRTVIVTTPNVAFMLHRLRLALFGRFPVTTVFHIREHLSLWSLKDFEYWASAMGFQVLRARGIGGITTLGLNRRAPNLFAVTGLYVLRPPSGGRLGG